MWYFVYWLVIIFDLLFKLPHHLVLKILFEVKDALDSNGNRRIIYSDVTPIYSAGNSSFLAYLWIKVGGAKNAY